MSCPCWFCCLCRGYFFWTTSLDLTLSSSRPGYIAKTQYVLSWVTVSSQKSGSIPRVGCVPKTQRLFSPRVLWSYWRSCGLWQRSVCPRRPRVLIRGRHVIQEIRCLDGLFFRIYFFLSKESLLIGFTFSWDHSALPGLALSCQRSPFSWGHCPTRAHVLMSWGHLFSCPTITCVLVSEVKVLP